jgi:hypothetical protein
MLLSDGLGSIFFRVETSFSPIRSYFIFDSAAMAMVSYDYQTILVYYGKEVMPPSEETRVG